MRREVATIRLEGGSITILHIDVALGRDMVAKGIPTSITLGAVEEEAGAKGDSSTSCRSLS